NRIHLGVGDAGDQVGRSGTTSGNRHANFSRHAGVAFRRKYRTLLMPRENVPDAASLQRVIQRHDGAAGVSKGEVDPFGAQAPQNDFCSLKHSPPVVAQAWASPPVFSLACQAANSSCRATALRQSQWDAAALAGATR